MIALKSLQARNSTVLLFEQFLWYLNKTSKNQSCHTVKRVLLQIVHLSSKQ
jgi:hypothetical protein